MKKPIKTLLGLVMVAALLAVGRWSAGWGEPSSQEAGPPEHAQAGAEEAQPSLWTCPMHAQIKLPDPGDCPICGMDLVPMSRDDGDGPRRLAMSEASRQLARIATRPVGRESVTRQVRMVGKIDYDETAVRTISAWVPGRLDRLFVDYTGVRVNTGDHLVRLYSPDLLNAQEELLSARERLSATEGESSRFLSESDRHAYESARGKLLLWGLTESQVAEIEARGEAEDHVMLTSPSSGVVIEKLVDQGGYVQTGTHIYRVADLNRLWVRLDAYEQDLAWLRYGQDITIDVEALPGEPFAGTISFIDPVIHEKTRTAKVRVNIDNTDGRLKPGMFVRAVASAELGPGGVVRDRYLAGKWVSPMHPEIVKDAPGECDVCGMDLVPAEELGLVSAETAGLSLPLVIPRSAVLVTGRRAVVYVEVPDTERPTFEGREIVLGPRAGDQYLVVSGLEEGERVVVNGAFRIDSSMQIRAKPSMMSMPGESALPIDSESRALRASLRPLLEAYLSLQTALAADDEALAREVVRSLGSELTQHAALAAPASLADVWRDVSSAAQAALESAEAAPDIEGLRASFAPLSGALLTLERELGHDGTEPLYEAYCPMAFDGEGAAWLQAGDAILNPYFGESMLRCGELRETFTPVAAAPMEEEHAGHGHAMTSAEAAPLAAVFSAYLEVQGRLAADDPAQAGSGFGSLLSAVLAATAAEGLDPEVEKHLHGMHSALLEVDASSDLERMRAAFGELSTHLIAIDAAAGNPLEAALDVVHCPMAFDGEGADWVQAGGSVANPYFGAEMLRCGSVTRVSAPK